MYLLLLAALLASPAKPGHGLVDVTGVIPDVVLDIRYATPDNFFRLKLYPVAKCFLRAPAAERLVAAANVLRKNGFRLLLYDCYRPQSVQKKMWKILPKPGYVANPAGGSHHSRGIAVDVSLVRIDGSVVQMPTAYDAFGPRARAFAEADISAEAKANRRRLQQAMVAAGFKINRAEWWHFRAVNLGRSPLLDVPLEALP